MRLYYLTKEEWARKIIEEKRFKLSTFNELNDPFELLGAFLGEKQERKIFKLMHVHWVNTIGMICTRRSWDSPVMWAHYGHSHKGICLGFDLKESKMALPVRYEAARLNGLLKGWSRDKPSDEQVKAIFTTKFKDWEYEKEWRLLAGLEEREAEDGKYYLDFGEDITLREVILGARCDASVKDFASLIENPKQSVKVFKARLSFKTFGIVRQRQVKSVTVPALKP